MMDVNLGAVRLVVKPDDITCKKRRELIAGIKEIKKSNSVYLKYPFLTVDETQEEWYNRVYPTIVESNTKKAGESTEDFLNRIFATDSDKEDQLNALLKLAATLFGQEDKVTPESLENASYPKIKEFLRELLEHCDLNTNVIE